MKLKSLAALIFRIIGALYILFALAEIPDAVFEKATVAAISVTVTGGILGWVLIYFSKKLASLFCKGLDE